MECSKNIIYSTCLIRVICYFMVGVMPAWVTRLLERKVFTPMIVSNYTSGVFQFRLFLVWRACSSNSLYFLLHHTHHMYVIYAYQTVECVFLILFAYSIDPASQLLIVQENVPNWSRSRPCRFMHLMVLLYHVFRCHRMRQTPTITNNCPNTVFLYLQSAEYTN